MQKIQDSVFSIVKTTSLSPAVFSFLQPSDDFAEDTPLGGILSDTKHGWLALGPKFCVVDLRSGLKVAACTFGAQVSNCRTTVTNVVELSTPLTNNSQQLLISLECEDLAGIICVFHVNGSQILRCIQTEVVVTELAVCDGLSDGPFTCFDGVVMAGTKSGEIFVFDLNRASLVQALKDISQGYDNNVRGENNPANITFLPLNAVHQLDQQRDLVLENEDHIAILLNENSLLDGQYIFRNPDGTVRMKAKRDHVRVTVLEYIPQLGSMAVGFNFGAFQIWNLMTLDLEYTSQVNVECLPVTQFGFQEPCDDPRAFCYLWVVFSVLDRLNNEEFPLAVMYSLTYQGKRMLSDTKCLYQDFTTATIRFQIELSTVDEDVNLVAGRCVSCHTYTVDSCLGGEGEESMLNLCQLVWECWGEQPNSPLQYGMLLFDLDQWYKDQMPATYQLQSNAFMSATWWAGPGAGEWAGQGAGPRGACALDLRVARRSVAVFAAATRLEEHFYPNSLHYECICLNTSETCVIKTIGIQRQIINSMDEVGPTALLNPTRLYNACIVAGLAPLYVDSTRTTNQEEQRRYLLSVALEARLSRFLKRCAHDWATGSHTGAGCTLPFLIDWCWQRALELKDNAKELTTPLFTSSTLPDRNVVRCLEHVVQQLTQLNGLLDAVLTKCCNLIVPDALSEIEEKYKGIGTVCVYLQVVQWFVKSGLLPEQESAIVNKQRLRTKYCNRVVNSQHYQRVALIKCYKNHRKTILCEKKRLKLHRLHDPNISDEVAARKSCQLLYIDQLIENEFGGEKIHQMWLKAGSENHGLYPPPSLCSLLRLYLLPDVAEEHKHSLVLYLLVDYSMCYDEVRYEAAIRRLMQFPTMFGLSNTSIKATQAFWHLDHRDFDFALDQLQCLTGNTLSKWQHNVVLSSLLAQKKTQAALQYLHVRKPAPIQNIYKDSPNKNSSKMNDHDKLEDWQACCNLYLARGLVFEALEVIRTCVQNATSVDEKVHLLNYFFKGCKTNGLLTKLLQLTLLPFEEEVFIRYLESCNETAASTILVIYLVQQCRYLEAQQYNSKLKKESKSIRSHQSTSDTLSELTAKDARDMLVEIACSSLPSIANTVAHYAIKTDVEPRVFAPKPMSVFVQATSPKNTFTYKSSFIQDTIENASETWVNKPKMRRGIKRALNIEDTPFICTPKLNRTKTLFSEFPSDFSSDSTPAKRSRMMSASPRTPTYRNDKLSQDMARLLDMPDTQTPVYQYRRSGAETPHSILKTRMAEGFQREMSPVDCRSPADSGDEATLCSDSNKHLRFTIPTASESGSTPSPPAPAPGLAPALAPRERESDLSFESCLTTTESHEMNEPHPLESPTKRLATPDSVRSKKSYKDTVRARRSLSISANSSLSEDPNTSIESIADIPVTLINPKYSGERRRQEKEMRDKSVEKERDEKMEETLVDVPKTPRGRRGIRSAGESTPLSGSRSVTPERIDSPVTPLRPLRVTRSRSRTPDISPRSSPLAAIPELPAQEGASEPHPASAALTVASARIRTLRSRSRTPERIEKLVESPRLEAITESPTKDESPVPSPTKRNLRSRSRTPEVEIVIEQITEPSSPRMLRSRAKTPEKLMSPKKDPPKSAKKSLSRIVLEANAKKNLEKVEDPETTEKPERSIECTPMKTIKPVSSLMDVTISPIASKSILQSSNESLFTESIDKEKHAGDDSVNKCRSLPMFTMNETKFGKSVLHSFESTLDESSKITYNKVSIEENVSISRVELKSLPAFTLSESCFDKSVLNSYQSSIADESSLNISDRKDNVGLKPSTEVTSFNITDVGKSVLGSCETSAVELADNSEIQGKFKYKDNEPCTSKFQETSSLMTSDSEMETGEDKIENIQKEKQKIVEIEREINEIEGDIEVESDEASSSEPSDGDENMEGDDDENMEGDDDDEEENEHSEDDSESSNEDQTEDDNDVISINDTDSDSSSDKLAIDEKSNSDTKSSSDFNNKDTERTDSEDLENVQAKLIAEVDADKVESVTEDLTETDPLNQAQISMMTDDNSVRDSEHSDVNLNYSDEMAEHIDKDIERDAAPPKAIEIEVTVEVASDKDTLETNFKQSPEKEATSAEQYSEKEPATGEQKVPTAIEKSPEKSTIKKITSETTEQTDILAEGDNNLINIPTIEDEQKEITKSKVDGNKAIEQSKGDSEMKAESPKRTRKQNQSSDKIIKDTEHIEENEDSKPKTRKRTQSNASNKSTTESQDDSEVSTPNTRRRAKTPTSTEVRKILTRRASKELEKLDQSQSILEETVVTTPKRRSTRSRSKTIDDNASVTSETSIRSTRSRASDNAEVKAAPIRKGRKSITIKPDLSVIPELTVEETSSKMETTSDIIEDYSGSRRLTRHQKALLQTWLEPKSPSRRTSTASRVSVTSEGDDDVSAPSAFDVQSIDRISLMNRGDFEGSPDPSETQSNFSPTESIASDASKQRRLRMTRAASEARSTPKAAKISRRISADIEGTESPLDSPARGRRASFNRACEALHTPKGRRTSVDVKKAESDSQRGSPAPSPSEELPPTPPRRARRASGASNTSQTKADVSKRSKKLSSVEEN